MKITNATVKKISPPESGYKIYWDSDLSGFGLRVTSTGYKSFIAESRVNGKTRRTTIAKFGGTKTADEARKMARAKLGKMAEGKDPSAEKRHQKAESATLADVATDYQANRRTSQGLPLKESTKADIEKHVSRTFADWANRPISRINRDMVQKRYAEHARRSTAQANQAMRVLRALINYAAAKYRDSEGNPIIMDNPVKVLRDASMLRAVPNRSNHVPLAQLGEWWSAVQAHRTDPALTTSSRSAADLVALIALTGLRISEARAIRWGNVDLAHCSLTLTDTKNRTNVILPLSDLATSIIEARPSGNAYIFPSRSKSAKTPHLIDCRGALAILANETGIEVTAHDLRRTFRAVAAACNIELWRCKALMNHKQNHDVTLAHYTDLNDVRNLKPESNQISAYFEEQRRIFGSDNIASMEHQYAKSVARGLR